MNPAGSRVTTNAELFEDGLLVTGIGMGVTIGVLVLLMFAIQGIGLFDRVVQRRAAAAVIEAGATSEVTPSPAVSRPVSAVQTPEGEIVAAIAAALALAEDESQARRILASAPAGTSSGAWQQAGRQHLMNQRGRPSR